jgi:ubiquitin C-terminal hydrolase
MPSYTIYPQNGNYSYLPSAIPLIRFQVCEKKRNRERCIYIESSVYSTIAQLKHQIAAILHIDLPLNKFVLEIFDEKQGQWLIFDNRYSSVTINDLKLRPGSIISVGYYDQQVSQDRRPVTSSSISNNNRELILRLCIRPMDTTDCIRLNIPSSSTLGKLRKQVYAQFNKMSKDRPVFVCNKDTWIKFDSNFDDKLLTNLVIDTYAFISTDYDEDSSNSKLSSGLCGLANLGSTCFMNSVFQCLSNIPEFTEKILAFTDIVNAPVTGEYIKLMKQIWLGKYYFIEPSSLLKSINDNLPHYASYRQHDAQEFMNHFLHLIHEEFSTKESIITELFYGQMRSTVKCLGCQQIETTNESISFLPLPISNHNQKNILYIKADGEQRLISIKVNSSVITIDDLIDCFVKQYEPTSTGERIEAIRIVNNRIEEFYKTTRSLNSIRDEELGFLECPKKLNHQLHIWCHFVDHSTGERFRPSCLLVCPNRDCYYTHLSDQIDQLLGHLCSMTGAPASDCYLYWKDQYGKRSELSVVASTDENLSYLGSITIEMATQWVDIYKAHYDTNRSIDNSGLHSLLADFFREEQLHGDYHCLKCPTLTKARQKSDLCFPLPRVLIIQLKRFTYDTYSNDKIDTYISFPLNGLDLNEYIIKDDGNKSSTKYDLVAVSNHTGSLTSGHYTTYAKNVQDGKWYLFDDKLVRKLDSNTDVVTKNAYILIYVQQSNDK